MVKQYETSLRSLESCILWQTILVKKNIDTSLYSDIDLNNEDIFTTYSEDYNLMKDII